MKPFLSVIIPAYNEEKNLKRGVLNSVNDYLKTKKFSWEVIILDDGSSDGTAEMAENFVKSHQMFEFRKEPHRGKGGTLIVGMEISRGENILFTDMDQSTPIDQFEKFLPKLKEGYDIVIGSRHGRPGQSPVRQLMAYGFSFLRSLILNLPYKDTQCGFKAFKKEAAEKIIKRLQVFDKKTGTTNGAVTAAFDLEMLFIARKLKMKVAEVPVDWYEYGERKEVSPIKDSWEGFRDLIRIRINAIQGKYGV